MTYAINIVNIDALYREHSRKELLDAIDALPVPAGHRPTIFVVIDNGRPVDDYVPGVVDLAKHGDVWIRVQDSSYEGDGSDGKLDAEQSFKKFWELGELFHGVAKGWEIGNEVNGDWLPADIWDRVRARLDHARKWGMENVGATFFLDETLLPFTQTHESLKLDWVGASCYPTNPRSLDEMKKRLYSQVPDTLKTFGQCDRFLVTEYGEDEWKAQSPSRMYLREDLLAPAFERYGGAYWSFQKRACPAWKGMHKAISREWAKR